MAEKVQFVTKSIIKRLNLDENKSPDETTKDLQSRSNLPEREDEANVSNEEQKSEALGEEPSIDFLNQEK